MNVSDKPTGMCELLAALEGTIAAADPGKRAAVAAMIDAYAREFPEEFRWAAGPQAPTLLYRLLTTIDVACRPEGKARRRQGPYLIDRKSYPQPDDFAARRSEDAAGAGRADACTERPEHTGSDKDGGTEDQSPVPK
jgi:hypothetical protein